MGLQILQQLLLLHQHVLHPRSPNCTFDVKQRTANQQSKVSSSPHNYPFFYNRKQKTTWKLNLILFLLKLYLDILLNNFFYFMFLRGEGRGWKWRKAKINMFLLNIFNASKIYFVKKIKIERNCSYQFFSLHFLPFFNWYLNKGNTISQFPFIFFSFISFYPNIIIFFNKIIFNLIQHFSEDSI